MDLSEDQYNWLMIWYKIATREGVLPPMTKVQNGRTNNEPFDATLNDAYYLQNDSTSRGMDLVPHASMSCSEEQDYESGAEQDYESGAEQDYESGAEQDYESSPEQDYESSAEKDYEFVAEQDPEYIAEQESRPEEVYESSTEHGYRTSPEQIYRSIPEQIYRPGEAQVHDVSAGHVYGLHESSEEQVYGTSAGQVYHSYDSSEEQVHGISARHVYGSYDSSMKQVYGTNTEQFYRPSADHEYGPNAVQRYRSSAERVHPINSEQIYNLNTTSEEWQPMFEYYSKGKFGPTDKGKIVPVVSVRPSNDGGVGQIVSSVYSRDHDDSIYETLDSMSSRIPYKVSSTNNSRTLVQNPSTARSPFLAPAIEHESSYDSTQRYPQFATQMETFVQNSSAYNYRHQSCSSSNNCLSQDVRGRSSSNVNQYVTDLLNLDLIDNVDSSNNNESMTMFSVPSHILAEIDDLVRRDVFSTDK
ncbi:uncharacterized protein C8R40DRAFT_1173729 [Lentinula edodes]|uniref:uncharacterized protein n=1 Tax=Lentinula edodes TaxID=5353 RepID=UPI001E8D303E|nr:uncharacterized protein C8R40DRAFT_1173729 [Lentinula edodes]KAH7872325.1 hypothetical protein C8R40DRAFT_1173729 [Lentinula edodes]